MLVAVAVFDFLDCCVVYEGCVEIGSLPILGFVVAWYYLTIWIVKLFVVAEAAKDWDFLIVEDNWKVVENSSFVALTDQ